MPIPLCKRSIEVDLALIGYYEPLLRDVELAIVTAAKQHNANALYLLQTVPGIGKTLSLVLLYEIHDIQRFPSVQDLVVYPALADILSRPLPSRLRRLTQPVTSPPNWFSTPRLPRLACL